MTIRRLVLLTAASLGLLLLMIAVTALRVRGPAAATSTTDGGAGPAVIQPTRVRPAGPVRGAELGAPRLVSLPPPAEAPALVEIPIDLIATPTPDGPDAVPLPMLTNIPPQPRDGSVVYLTFDDGPDPVYTNQILDVLARHGARATFFVLGSSVDAHPATARRIAAEGHALGNHTYAHEALPRVSDEHVAQTLAATSDAIVRVTGRRTACVRPPYGSLDRPTFELLGRLGYTVSMWEVDSRDWQTTDSYAIASHVLRATDLGDRVLFHDGPSGRSATVAALESVLSVLTARGVRFHGLPGCG